MKTHIAAMVGVAAVLVGFLAIPFLPVADATPDPSRSATGYKTCFLERRAAFTEGAPRWMKAPRCVFDE